MTDDLMERIEGCIANADYEDEWATLIDARDHIEALAAENERLRTALERIGVATRNEARAGDKGYVSRYGINGIVSAALEKQP
jgi:hypothetical protein